MVNIWYVFISVSIFMLRMYESNLAGKSFSFEFR